MQKKTQFYFIKLFDADLQCEFTRTFFESDSNKNPATPLLQFGRPLWPASITALKFENHSIIAMKTECPIHKKECTLYTLVTTSKCYKYFKECKN